MSRPTYPFMSIVVCSYNGARVIGRTLASLVSQDYPRDRFEIIVVDDGSTDTTGRIAQTFPVRYIRQHNQGVAAARNTGLQAVRGDIYVNFDDDSIAEPNWLSELARGYAKPNIAGVGGQIQAPAATTLIDQFMTVTGCGNPAPITLGGSKSPFRRFIAYLQDRLFPTQNTSTGIIPVRELNGANASFPVELLRAISGWSADLSGVEDTEICKRLAERFPNLTFYSVPAAKITHDPKLTLRGYLRRPYRRGAVNLKYYRRYGMTPPIFPFPLAWLAGTILVAAINPLLAPVAALLLPQLLYCWWPLRAIRERQPAYLLFTYIQFAEESAILAGLTRGYILAHRSRSRHA